MLLTTTWLLLTATGSVGMPSICAMCYAQQGNIEDHMREQWLLPRASCIKRRTDIVALISI